MDFGVEVFLLVFVEGGRVAEDEFWGVVGGGGGSGGRGGRVDVRVERGVQQDGAEVLGVEGEGDVLVCAGWV